MRARLESLRGTTNQMAANYAVSFRSNLNALIPKVVPDRISYTVILHLSISTIIVFFLTRHPILTNDGPVHLAFAHLLYTNISEPLQATAYVENHHLSPNWATYIVMKMLFPLVGDHGAEALVQAACLILPAWAGYACMRAMGQATNAVASLLIYPVMINQLFYLGLYNSALACAAYFAAIGFFSRLHIKGRWRDAAALGAALIVAYFCHASGFIAAWATVGALVAYRQLRQANYNLADRWLAKAALALLLPLPLVVLFALASEHAPVAYGMPVLERISHFSTGWLFRTVSGGGPPTILLVVMLVSVGGLAILREVSDWRPRKPGAGPSTGRSLRYGAVCVAAAFGLALAFPDVAGGGWTHFRRFEVYAYLALVLAMAEFPFRAWQKAAVGLMASLIFVGLFGAMMRAQRAVDRDLAQFAEVDRQVGSHCTVMPIVVQERPAPPERKKPLVFGYDPYHQATNRMELHGDRVVLYNYLSRLDVYPIRFRPEIEPQANLFKWEPWQQDIDYHHFDIDAYQRRAHLNVDYILVWGSVDTAGRDLQAKLRREQSSALAVGHSSGGLLTLIRRPTRGRDACTG